MAEIECLTCGWGDNEKKGRINYKNAALFAVSFRTLMVAHYEMSGNTKYRVNDIEVTRFQWFLTRSITGILLDELYNESK